MNSKSPKPVIETLPVEYRFTLEEIGELARKSALETQRVNELEDKKKQVMSDLKAQIEAAQATVNVYSAKISNGYEMRETECEVVFDPGSSTKHFYNAKTAVFVRSMEMTRRDFELSLPFEKAEEEKGLAPDPRANPEKLAESNLSSDGDTCDLDEDTVQQCVEVIRSEQKASVSLLQRRLRLSYGRATAFMSELEKRGIVGPTNGTEPREILIELTAKA